MAIKTSGTTRLGNSGELQNITSLDSTTAATIGAAAGGGAGAIFFEHFSSTTTNWQPKIAGDVYVVVAGAGGTGMISKYYSYAGSLISRLNVGGGGSGGVVVHKFTGVSTSQSPSTITVGPTHTTSQNSNGAATAGSAGGSSSITIGGVTITAGGGGGGTQVGGAAYGLDRTAVGGAGGSASGGNIGNFAGVTGATANTGTSQLYVQAATRVSDSAFPYLTNFGNFESLTGAGSGGYAYISETTVNLSTTGYGGIVRVYYAG